MAWPKAAKWALRDLARNSEPTATARPLRGCSNSNSPKLQAEKSLPRRGVCPDFVDRTQPFRCETSQFCRHNWRGDSRNGKASKRKWIRMRNFDRELSHLGTTEECKVHSEFQHVHGPQKTGPSRNAGLNFPDLRMFQKSIIPKSLTWAASRSCWGWPWGAGSSASAS